MLESAPLFEYRLNGETWSTPALCSGDTGRLVVIADRSGHIVALDSSGAPVWTVAAGSEITSSPTPITIDGVEIILIGTHEGLLLALRASDGAHCWSTHCGRMIRSTAAATEFEGEAAIFVSAYGPRLLRLNGRGDILWRKYLPRNEWVKADGTVSSPLIADVDLDGRLEVVVGIRSRRCFCLDAATGKLKWSRDFRYDPDSTFSFAVIDGIPTVFLGGGEHTAGEGDNALIALRGDSGEEVWRTRVGGGVDSCPVLVDVAGSRPKVLATSLATAKCFALDARTGSLIWEHRFDPAPGSHCNHEPDGVCRPTSGIYFTENAICRSYTTPLVADLDQDGALEVVAGSNNGQLVILDLDSGHLREGIHLGGMIRGSPILGDLDRDGRNELIIVSGDRLLAYRTLATGQEWPMFKGEPRHLGIVGESPPRPPLNGRSRRQHFVWLRLVWRWIVIDTLRYGRYQIEKRLFRRFGIRLAQYNY